MTETTKRRKAKVKVKPKSNIAERLNQVPSEIDLTEIQTADAEDTVQSVDEIKAENEVIYDSIFESWDAEEFEPQDFMIDVPIDSLESAVGYSSLFRQFHQEFIRMVAFHRSESGGSLSIEEARNASFHACTNKEEAKKAFQSMMRLPLESLNFIDLEELHQFAPRVAERFWERAKREGQKEFISGHLGANITFPVGYMKQLWNIARYLGVRDSFIDEWNPKGGIEVALIDMMAQTYFQWQYWLEQTVKRSQTRPREEHHAYQEWKRWNERTKNAKSWQEGYWFPSYVTEQQAIEQAVQLADRFNRIFMRTLRQLRDLRRYTVTINNPNQVNIAADCSQQVNISKADEDKAKKITS